MTFEAMSCTKRGRPAPRWQGGLILALAALSMTGCRDLATAPEGQVPSTIRLEQSSIQLGSLGERVAIQATVLDQFGRAIAGVNPSFVAQDGSVISVASSGEVQALANGTTTVTVRVDAHQSSPTGSGYRAGVIEADLPVEVRQEVGSIRLASGQAGGTSPVLLWAVGQRRDLEVEVLDPLGSLFQREVTLQFESLTPNVLSVESTGQIQALREGFADVQITAEGQTQKIEVEVRSDVSFGACVSSSSSRLGNPGAATPSGAAGAAGCSVLILTTVIGEP